MKEMKESIAFMQKNLNRLLEESGEKNCQSSRIYSLSVMLDKEIVRYYKNLTAARY
ncbi:MAG: Spo0E family sporulation regulatory protein-aspartic acid phosphatase [Cellulosilyticum sp.]|nr:Spo0E family sporulation regulatory protein-aspartic acid phosphatase [Cellulosilyticum sp.]